MQTIFCDAHWDVIGPADNTLDCIGFCFIFFINWKPLTCFLLFYPNYPMSFKISSKENLYQSQFSYVYQRCSLELNLY